jgi:hypothetical protein
MKKQLLIAMAGLLPAVTLTANAMAPMDDAPAMNHDGASLGIFYDQTVGGMVPKLTLMKGKFVGSVGYSYKKTEPANDNNGDSFGISYVPMNFSYLRNITPELAYSVGPGGMWSANSADNADNEYVYGAQMSLYYFPAKNVMFTASLMPIAKEKETTGTTETEYLREGAIGMSYVF